MGERLSEKENLQEENLEILEKEIRKKNTWNTRTITRMESKLTTNAGKFWVKQETKMKTIWWKITKGTWARRKEELKIEGHISYLNDIGSKSSSG